MVQHSATRCCFNKSFTQDMRLINIYIIKLVKSVTDITPTIKGNNRKICTMLRYVATNMLEKLAFPSLEGRQKLFQLTIYCHVVIAGRNVYSKTCIKWTLH